MDSPTPAPRSSDSAAHANRPRHWQLRTRRLAFARRPLVMGILNVTPDSFSDGGRYVDASVAIEAGLQLAAEGADILDIGGESTRPYSASVDAETELERVLPVLESLAGQVSIPISIDTSKASVARAALDAGAEIINDVTGLAGDSEMLALARTSQAGMCIMHMQGTPQTMQDAPTYDDVVADILEYLRARRDQLVAEGLDPARIVLDPGIGFGKTHQQNLTLLRNAARFHELNAPLLFGYSRKGFIGKLIGESADRTAGGIGVALSLAVQGVQILRVHDVAGVQQALTLFEATGGLDDDRPSESV